MDAGQGHLADGEGLRPFFRLRARQFLLGVERCAVGVELDAGVHVSPPCLDVGVDIGDRQVEHVVDAGGQDILHHDLSFSRLREHACVEGRILPVQEGSGQP